MTQLYNSIVDISPMQFNSQTILQLFCSADDLDGDPLTYDWECTNHGASIKGASNENPYKLINTKENLKIYKCEL